MNAIHGGGIGLYFDDAASTLVCLYLCNDVSIDVASYGGRGTGLRVPSTSSNNFFRSPRSHTKSRPKTADSSSLSKYYK